MDDGSKESREASFDYPAKDEVPLNSKAIYVFSRQVSSLRSPLISLQPQALWVDEIIKIFSFSNKKIFTNKNICICFVSFSLC